MNVTMKLWRDDFHRCACMEYSYVPEGFRRVIQLTPTQQAGTHVDVVPDGTLPSRIQVYTLNNNNLVGTVNWNFPMNTPPPPGVPIVSASVEVYQAQMYAVGTVNYADGTTIAEKLRLDDKAPHCPEERINCDGDDSSE